MAWRPSAVLAASAWLGACAPATSPVRLGVSPWIADDLAAEAAVRGHLDAAQIDVVPFGIFGDVNQAFAIDAVDVVSTSSVDALVMAAHIPSARIVFLTDRSIGGDALVVRPGITSVADLVGKVVATEAVAQNVYLLRRALELAGVPGKAVRVLPVELDRQVEVWDRGDIDAVVTYDPLVTLLEARGGRAIFSTRDTPSDVVDVLLVREAILTERTDELRSLVDGWLAVRQELETDPERLVAALAEREDLTPDQMRTVLRRVDLLDEAANRALLGGERPAFADELDQVQRRMRAYGLLDATFDSRGVLDDRLVAGARDDP